ncbi:MAG: threonine aldolase family protein [Phycisphaerales bacterium]
MRSLRSDNNAGLCPEALAALIEANDGSHAVGYGDDAWTTAAIAAFHDIFGSEISAWMVASGTAANTLAIASLTQPWQRILCHAHAHLNDDESTAPERITHCRVTAIETEPGRSKLLPRDIEQHGSNTRGDVHQPAAGVVSISNPTEFGEVYSPEEMSALCAAAHAFGYRLHVDGARFANAVASLGCHPRAITADAGIDALSFGGTKNGLAYGEAVIFFPQRNGDAFTRAQHDFPFHRKSTGHLLSKHRFVAAPFAATLKDNIWLRHAAHANAMATRLANGLEKRGIRLMYPCQANGVFAVLAPEQQKALESRGHGFYMFGDAAWNLARFMASFNTETDEVDRLIHDLPPGD